MRVRELLAELEGADPDKHIWIVDRTDPEDANYFDPAFVDIDPDGNARIVYGEFDVA